jgi:hypothetical protein
MGRTLPKDNQGIPGRKSGATREMAPINPPSVATMNQEAEVRKKPRTVE